MSIRDYQAIKPAKVSQHLQSPFSTEFEDIYYHPEHGLEESDYVFVQGNQLPERFAQLPEHGHFVIGETGFGTGLNFLQVWRCFLRYAPKTAKLTFFSVEKHPLPASVIAQGQTHFPELKAPIAALVEQYPPFSPGLHSRQLHPQIELKLFYGDITLGLAQFSAPAVHAWFLDGFSPAKNQAMWQDAVFSAMAALSQPGSTVATFTAAGFVRRGLAAQGFTMQKTKGFGQKRERLVGTYTQQKSLLKNTQEQPWFSDKPQSGISDSFLENKQPVTKARRIAIIGAGLAGCSSAYALTRSSSQALDIHLFDRQSQLAAGTSKNKAGVLHTNLSHQSTPQTWYYWQAYQFALAHLPKILPDWSASGVLYIADTDKQASAYQRAIDSQLYPSHLAHWLDAKALRSTFGHQAKGALWLPQAGHLSPPQLCQALIDQSQTLCQQQTSSLALHLSTEVSGLSLQNERWQLDTSSGRGFEFDDVILANAASANALLGNMSDAESYDFQLIRGQLSILPEDQLGEALKQSLCGKGYATPAIQDGIVFGASFNIDDHDDQPKSSDHIDNLQKLCELLPQDHPFLQRLGFVDALTDAAKQTAEKSYASLLPSLKAQVGFRCNTRDYLPLVGALPSIDYFQQQYSPIGKGQLKRQYPDNQPLKGLHCHLALGSRGITTCLLNAHILAASLLGLPLPVEKDIARALHPARFLFRQIKRGER
ncbi:MAG: bifunctional tRNA (5-methylaminomethyl-2-thiouridine)(34)-methyltransferase MnmD/FAD-dependent 5-carboxymethylaminomethyl-2-thiouridine(34) oxidoreductase MnmC [Pseudomonadota bacterium]|nr:bifunctional tRNA (5-methylaminomethyl-2-thiouridine)(34)-methyltransferase MnmD/FAD-dependent 5-carboxymethylaminomethyl-2-thiouridine(34) oxidoreductase MnmC [Pseudomonadota bacterium]